MSLPVRARVARASFSLDVAIEVADGETVGLVGPNGAGKSTLLRAIAGLDGPPAPGGPFGLVFQDLRLFPHMSALDNVAFGLRARGTGRTAARIAARAVLDRTGAGHLAAAKPGALSGGEAQRVALARALATEPRVLLLDEPLSALDVRARAEVRALLAATLEGHTGPAIVVSHEPVDIMTLCDRIAILEGGRITQTGTPDEIRRAPATPYASELVGLNLYRGTLEPLGEGVARLRTATGDLIVAASDTVAGEAIVTVRPGDVVLHTDPPSGSARNVIEGVIASVAEGERARVWIDGSPPVTADVTIGSVRSMSLRPGARVYASFKATEATVVGRDA